jgi:hypothetical protein
MTQACMSVEQFQGIHPEQQPVKQEPQMRLPSAARAELKIEGRYKL